MEMETIGYKCPKCLSALELDDILQCRKCLKCNVSYPTRCPSTHGASGYAYGSLLLGKTVICSICGAEVITCKESLGPHLIDKTEHKNKGGLIRAAELLHNSSERMLRMLRLPPNGARRHVMRREAKIHLKRTLEMIWLLMRKNRNGK